MAIKLFTRWYYTPHRLGRIFPQASSYCFRGCPVPGTFLLIFWECEKVSPIWQNAFALVDKFVGSHVALTYNHCLLFEGIPNSQTLESLDSHFIHSSGLLPLIGSPPLSPSLRFPPEWIGSCYLNKSSTHSKIQSRSMMLNRRHGGYCVSRIDL